jgi:acetyl esterase
LTGRTDSALIVAGDSAGANLAALMAQRAARLKQPRLAMQVLVYPVTQPDLNTSAYLDPSNAAFLCREDMQWFWDHYLPHASARLSPEVSPLLVDRVDNLPATVMVTAEHDVLRAEGEQYAERLRAAGVPLQIRNFEGQMHGFFSMPQVLPASDRARQFVCDAIRRVVER